MESILQNLTSEVEKATEEENELKTQLVQLTQILDPTTRLLTTSAENGLPALEEIKIRTKTTIHEINIELLKVKDKSMEKLREVKTVLEELASDLSS
jgi:ElaB/YqjD/DUF883 family membrane-anchored ribosome-binding protein